MYNKKNSYYNFQLNQVNKLINYLQKLYKKYIII